jgi:hypothetical protein
LDIFPPRAIGYDCAGEDFLRVTGLRWGSQPPRLDYLNSHQQGVWAMRFILGLIVGVALTVAGAAIHDNMEPGASSPLVNWTTANDLKQTTVNYVRDQFDRLVKWVTSS